MINNLFCEEIPVNQCDWAFRNCPNQPVAVVAMVNDEIGATMERRPFCEHHLAFRAMSMDLDPDGNPPCFHYEIHPLTWLQRRTLV